MNKMHTIATETRQDVAESEFSFIDLLIIIAKRKKLIIGLPFATAIIAIVVSFTIADEYLADTKLLPPQQAQSGAAALLSQLGGAAVSVAGAAGIKNPNELYIGMLKSRAVADKLIERFDLRKAYSTNSLEVARRKLAANTTIDTGKDGLIMVQVGDTDRKRVAQLANAYVEELLKLTKVIAVTEASQRRVFFERQLEISKNNLATAEMALKTALDTHGVISVDSDSRAILETIGGLRAKISAKEIQFGAMQAFVTSGNQDYKRVREELNSLRAELSRLQNGRPSVQPALGQPAQAPSGLANIKILRDVKYYQMLYELLAKQYEVARLDEAKDVSIIQVLDRATEPERKAKPRRLLIAVIASMLALMAAVVLAFLLETKEKLLNSPRGVTQWKEFTSRLRTR